MKKIELGQNSKVNIKWNVLPVDYSHEAEANIISLFAKKYGIPKDNVKVEPIFINENGCEDEDALSTEAAQNIQDPKFQQDLFRKYIAERKIENVDFDKIIEIDNAMNANIDYEIYEKHKRYVIKWVKWDNFMSYGPNNYIDLTKLKGLVLLSSEPANQGGKTTFCLDLFRFLLFGKVTSREDDWTLSRVFNDHIPSATEVNVEGCISIDGVDYVVKRTVTRPDLKRRTEKSKVTNKVSYYKIVNGEYIGLEDEEENENESSGRETNKAIKEAIGNERDFDLMIVVDQSNLKKLISLKDTDRGRLIARWIGLLPLEEKDKLARDYFNKSVSPKLLLNKYNKEDLIADNEELEANNEELIEDGVKWSKERDESEARLKEYRERRDVYLQSMPQIDDELTKTDKNTVERKAESLIEEGKNKAAEKKKNEDAYKKVKDVEFDEDDYKKKVSEDKKLSISEGNIVSANKTLRHEIEHLKSGEFCPTCGAKLKGVDNKAAIAKKEKEIKDNEAELEEIRARLDEIGQEIDDLEDDRASYNEKVRLELVIDKNEVDLENLRGKLKECNRILKDLQKNDEAIRKNNELNAKINALDVSIKEEEAVKKGLERDMDEARSTILANRRVISENKQIISTINDEEKLVYNWKVYLEMVGKNGVSKMVLRSALPLINGELKRLLTDVCDFDVEVGIDSHNDVAFYQIHNGVRRKLGAGSGFEQTVASLALRSVLSRISTFSKPSFVVFDEILGGVADENYDQAKILYDKIAKDYACILQITHNKAIADWHDTQVLIKKENDISRIEVVK
ncbi:MAG: hypothetical protein J6Y37_06365 [Paludibacteraceae bacterium]|nr:hypothetical protein [Paludibacteraceae bacterium]